MRFVCRFLCRLVCMLVHCTCSHGKGHVLNFVFYWRFDKDFLDTMYSPSEEKRPKRATTPI